MDGLQSIDGHEYFIHGGDRFRDLADGLLSDHGDVHHLVVEPNPHPQTHVAAIDERLARADALVLSPWFPWRGVFNLPDFDATRFERAPSLKVISGTFDFRLDWIDLDGAERRGVTLVDTSRVMTSTVAEFGVGITFALLRDIPAAIDVVRSGSWLHPRGPGAFVFRDLADCRVGLAGYGSINRRYRSYIRPYGCDVTICDPFVEDAVVSADRVARADTLVELAGRSDIFVVAIPPTPTTLRVIDREVIDALPSGSLFVLLNRMAVVEQEPLWDRIRAGELRAAIDVFEPEPPPSDAWFRGDPNALPTPHIAGNVLFAHERCFREACSDAVRVVTGAAPLHAATVRDKRLYDGTLTVGSRPAAT